MNSFPILLALTATALLTLATPASAHAHLKSATPAMNGKVQSPVGELDLTFSEGINPKFTGVKVTGPDKKAVSTGPVSLDAGADTTIKVPISAPLAAGPYKIDWHALATDGHKTSGSYTFTVSP